jgi:hypothetical protein
MNSTCGVVARDQIQFHPASFADSDARLFWWEGDLYRGIAPRQAALFSRLFEQGIIQHLVDRRLLVGSELSPLAVDGYQIVIRQTKVPFASYPQEWPAPMLKHAALAILDLAIELSNHRLTLKDAHPWNVLFDGCRPVYVDVGSIIGADREPGWSACDEFCRFCLFPLLLMANRHDRIARCLIAEYEGVRRSELISLGGAGALARLAFSRIAGRATSSVHHRRSRLDRDSNEKRRALLRRLRRDVQSVNVEFNLPAVVDAESPNRAGEPLRGWSANQERLCETIARLQPASVLILAAGFASFSGALKSAPRARVISFDSDATRAASIYRYARDHDLRLLPLVIDFTKPTPSVGFSSHYSIAASERLKCEMVVAPSLVDRLVFERCLNFDLIAQGLALFSTRWVAVEFPQRDDPWVRERLSENSSWYRLENFINSLQANFRTVEILGQRGSRRLIVCEK